MIKMEKKFLFLVCIVVGAMVQVHSECCYKTNLRFIYKSPLRSSGSTALRGCFEIGAKYDTEITVPGYISGAAQPTILADSFAKSICLLDVCGDGKPVAKGTYCGVGKCNPAGCDCAGGCIPGDAEKNFQALYGDRVSNVGRSSTGQTLDYILSKLGLKS